MNKKVEKFVRERNEMLAKNSVEELEKFFKKWHRDVYKEFKASKPIVKQATLYKMICNVPELKGTDLEKEATVWLRTMHMQRNLFVKKKEPCEGCPDLNRCYDDKEPCEKVQLANDDWWKK